MKLREQTALTFDDVLLVPKYSEIHSRGAVSTATQITPEIQLNIPIISSNMDTVTEAAMAVEMARAGGIGIIHRFLTIERQVAEVSRVKRAESFRVDDPVTSLPETPLKEAIAQMRERETSGLVVVDGGGKGPGPGRRPFWHGGQFDDAARSHGDRQPQYYTR